ncbi:hypothetical protein T03_9122 [Trichinella britovi]|uniref:Uncharacterized protein n=1 Tax=Trichinella britovi TaxID=45882 RepID=A0A0V1CRM6_TRIBR|nr:hypothetical protein T03_9122 [Trichinella britovi]
MKTQRRRQKCLYDCHANETRFCLNYSVWLAMPRRQKLDRNWWGPHLIVEACRQCTSSLEFTTSSVCWPKDVRGRDDDPAAVEAFLRLMICG